MLAVQEDTISIVQPDAPSSCTTLFVSLTNFDDFSTQMRLFGRLTTGGMISRRVDLTSLLPFFVVFSLPASHSAGSGEIEKQIRSYPLCVYESTATWRLVGSTERTMPVHRRARSLNHSWRSSHHLIGMFLYDVIRILDLRSELFIFLPHFLGKQIIVRNSAPITASPLATFMAMLCASGLPAASVNPAVRSIEPSGAGISVTISAQVSGFASF